MPYFFYHLTIIHYINEIQYFHLSEDEGNHSFAVPLRENQTIGIDVAAIE